MRIQLLLFLEKVFLTRAIQGAQSLFNNDARYEIYN